MDNQQPGDDVGKVVAMPKAQTSADISDLLQSFSESRCKTLYIQLFKHFSPKVKAYLLRLGLVESVAEELMQETLLAVWRKAHMYDRSKAAASTWIFTLARNQSIDWMRKQKYPECSLDEWSEELQETDHGGEQMVDADRIHKAMQTLPENQAQVLYMSFFEGRSHSDISARLGIPLGSVKSRIRLASEKLQTMWRSGV